MLKNFFNDKREKRLESRDFWKQRKMEEQAEDERSRDVDLANSCPSCYIIRSPYEIEKGICDSCDYSQVAI